jgi:hypothetical protein
MVKTAFTAGLVLLLALLVRANDRISWNVEGVIADACQCYVFCPCEFQSLPTFGHCDDTAVLNITKGRYGNVILDGTRVAATGQSPKGMRMSEAAGNLTFARIYIPKEASEEQKDALVEIARIFFGKKVGQKQRMSADEKSEQVEMKVLQEPNHYRIEIPNILNLEIVTPVGGDGKSPLVLRNSPYATLSDIRIGRSKIYQYTANSIRWDYSGRSASIRNFRLDNEHLLYPEKEIKVQEPQHNHE